MFGFYTENGHYVPYNRIQMISKEGMDVMVNIEEWHESIRYSRHDTEAECDKTFRYLVAEYENFKAREFGLHEQLYGQRGR